MKRPPGAPKITPVLKYHPVTVLPWNVTYFVSYFDAFCFYFYFFKKEQSSSQN